MTPAIAFIIFLLFLAGSGYAVHRWAPQTWDAGKGKLADTWDAGTGKIADLWHNRTATAEPAPSPAAIAYPPPSQAEFSPPPDPGLAALNTTPEPVTPANTTASVTQTVPVCDWPNAGLPNYFATSKEGHNCANSSTAPDDECRSNPPTTYNGIISLLAGTSTPDIRCCVEDGQCHWASP